MQNKATKD